MNDLLPFIDMIRAHSCEEGPRLVLADWLEERGDPRAAWLRYGAEIWRRARDGASEKSYRPALPHYHRSLSWRKVGPDVRRLWACACVRFLPLGEDGQLLDLVTAPALRCALAESELYACGILTDLRMVGAVAFGGRWETITEDPIALAVYRAAQSCRADSACDAVVGHLHPSTEAIDAAIGFLDHFRARIGRRAARFEAELWCVTLAKALCHAKNVPPPLRE